MTLSKTQKYIIALVVLLVLGALSYIFFFRNANVASVSLNNSVVTTSDKALNNSGIVGQDILILVQKLSAISIDNALFSGALFTNLKDYSIPLNPESQGRLNPFAPIGSDSGTVTVSVPKTVPKKGN